MIKTGSKNNLYPHRHFTEHLMSTLRKSTRESDLNHKNSESFDPMTQKQYQILPAMIHTHELYRKIKA
jgi:hypothetical protein